MRANGKKKKEKKKKWKKWKRKKKKKKKKRCIFLQQTGPSEPDRQAPRSRYAPLCEKGVQVPPAVCSNVDLSPVAPPPQLHEGFSVAPPSPGLVLRYDRRTNGEVRDAPDGLAFSLRCTRTTTCREAGWGLESEVAVLATSDVCCMMRLLSAVPITMSRISRAMCAALSLHLQESESDD